MTESITLRDVALAAGVSLGTVSNVFNNRKNVSDETRQRVLRVASDLGYHYQVRVATVPQGRPLATVAMLVKLDSEGPLNTNPFYSHILAGIERECTRNNIALMYANVQVDESLRPLAWPRMLLDQRIDGILVVGAFLDQSIDELRALTHSPIVLVDAYDDQQSCDSVTINNYQGAFAAVSYLVKNGHVHIGLVGSRPDGFPSIRERRQGYSDALAFHAIQQSYICDTMLTRQGGFKGTLSLLKDYPQITAIFACADHVAAGVFNAAQSLNIAVPQKLSVIGFDDIPLDTIDPFLTTMRVDRPFMGTTAVKLLAERALDSEKPIVNIVVSTKLIVRSSVAAQGG